MKKSILKTLLALSILVNVYVAKANENHEQYIFESKILLTTTFGVRGNCGMCKSTIEKAALSVKGVIKATWDVEKKEICVTYDSKKVKLDQIHYAIAQSGYDTESIKANEINYIKLPGCCQYDKNMPISKNNR